jgi:hypothetical protein
MLDAGSATVFPTAMAIAATARDSDAYDVGRAIAREGRAVGIHINFSPVVDVNNNPSNPVINTRSFGENAARVARLSALFVRGAQDGGQLATAKHFPDMATRTSIRTWDFRSSAPRSRASIRWSSCRSSSDRSRRVARHDGAHRAAGDRRRQHDACDVVAAHHHGSLA